MQAHPPRDVLLIFEPAESKPDGGKPDGGKPAGVLRLRLSADPDAARLHLQQGRVWRADGPPGPFYRRLAEDLVGARLKRLAQVRGDRIAILEFRDTPGGARRSLLAELFGRRPNLVLVDGDDRVLDFLVQPPRRGSKPGQAGPRLAKDATWNQQGSRLQVTMRTAMR